MSTTSGDNTQVAQSFKRTNQPQAPSSSPTNPQTPVDKARAAQQANDTSLRLFNRTVELTIAAQPTSQSSAASADPSFFTKQSNAIVITGMRVKFEIKKNLGKEPNICTCSVYNLSADTRRALDSKPLYAILRAGYDGVPRLLFEGHITYAQSRREGTEWETKLQIGDGQRAYTCARMSRSYSGQVTAYQVLNDCATSMGMKLPPNAQKDQSLKQQLSASIVAHGPTRDVLTKLLAPYGYGWSIQGGKLVILSDLQTSGGSARVIDQEAGMIGSPERGVPRRPGDPSDVSIESLLYPEIQPGGEIEVDSESLEGTFKVTDVHHAGDTHGTEWQTKIKALPLGASKPRRTARR